MDDVTGMLLPTDLDEALELRPALLKRLEGNTKAQQEQIELCRRSIVYWVNWYCWTYVIRKYGEGGRVLKRGEFDSHIPLVTWPVQDAALRELQRCVESGDDAIIDKSRDMGASWLLVLLGVHYWLFADKLQPAEIGYCGRVEDDVDKAGNPKCLFWKADYCISRLPEWMVPGGDPSRFERGTDCRSHLIIKNPVTGSVIRGEATTDHIFRGDRLLFIGFDEFAAHEHGTAGWQAASDSTACKIGNSTPIGPGTEYTAQRNKGLKTGSPNVITLGYWDHPDKGQGRKWVIDEDGSVTGISGRGYWNSPFFEAESQRRDQQDLGQNILIDHTTSGDLLFNSTIISQAMKQTTDPVRCEIAKKDGRWQFVEAPRGRWFTWCAAEPDTDTNYVIGADPSYGKGKANSAACVIDRMTGSVVAEFADPFADPSSFADELMLAAARSLADSAVPHSLAGKSMGRARRSTRTSSEAITGSSTTSVKLVDVPSAETACTAGIVTSGPSASCLASSGEPSAAANAQHRHMPCWPRCWNTSTSITAVWDQATCAKNSLAHSKLTVTG